MHGLFQRDQERVRELADILAGDHRRDAGQRQGRCRIDPKNFRVCVGRADHMGMQRAIRDREIVGIAPASRQEGGVFLANKRSA
jgi:hypothetical protein